MNKIKDYKVLVTGAAGFIGSHLVDQLLDDGYTVVGLDNLHNGKLENIELAQSHPKFNFIRGDILNKEELSRAMENIDIVYHLACLGVRHSLHSPFENHQVNAEGTLNVLECALKKKTGYRKLSNVLKRCCTHIKIFLWHMAHRLFHYQQTDH